MKVFLSEGYIFDEGWDIDGWRSIGVDESVDDTNDNNLETDWREDYLKYKIGEIHHGRK